MSAEGGNMLVDITIDPHYNAQIVAGELEAAGLTQVTLYWSAGIARGVANPELIERLKLVPGVQRVLESDGSRISSSIAPVIPKASFGLGLCDRNTLFTPQELQELHDDLAELARARRNIPPSDELIGSA